MCPYEILDANAKRPMIARRVNTATSGGVDLMIFFIVSINVHSPVDDLFSYTT